jgi:1-acyl-sn-glycerol-3-phosphate acyltransferase
MFYWVVKAVLAPFLRLFRPWAEGAEHVPRTGPAILASNHLSFSDHFFAPLPLPRKVVFLAKSEYFTGRGIKGLFSRAFFSGVGQIPVDRSGGEASERALATGLRVLAGGQLLGIYPEGTRTPDGRLFRGKTGVARLALEAQVPVIPCAMIGGFEFQPPGRITPRLRVRPGVRFGKPLDFSRYYGMESDGLVLRAVTDEIIYEIMKLSGQEYVDVYAARHKARQHAERRAHRHDGAAKSKASDTSAAGEVAAGPAAAGEAAAGPAAAGEAAAEAAAREAAGDASAAEPGEAAAGEAGAAEEASAAEAGTPEASAADAGAAEAAASDQADAAAGASAADASWVDTAAVTADTDQAETAPAAGAMAGPGAPTAGVDGAAAAASTGADAAAANADVSRAGGAEGARAEVRASDAKPADAAAGG